MRRSPRGDCSSADIAGTECDSPSDTVAVKKCDITLLDYDKLSVAGVHFQDIVANIARFSIPERMAPGLRIDDRPTEESIGRIAYRGVLPEEVTHV